MTMSCLLNEFGDDELEQREADARFELEWRQATELGEQPVIEAPRGVSEETWNALPF